MRPTAIIIGGGLGGLFTGALLVREGYHVTVLEKNAQAGGGLQTFTRQGTSFDTGMHILAGLRHGGPIYQVCNYLGIIDQLHLRPADRDCIDEVTYLRSNTTYRIPEGRACFTQYLQQQFPHEAGNIARYVTRIYELAQEVPLFNMRPAAEGIAVHSQDFLWPADTLIAHYIKDARLRDLLAYMNPMYGGVEGHTPAYIHALINVAYIDGTDRFDGGSKQLADSLIDVIGTHGEVLTGEEVVAIDVTDRRVSQVRTAQGSVYSVDYYISDIHPCSLLKIVSDNAFPKAYRMRLQEIPVSYSCFTLYIVFKPGAFPYINHTCYYQDDYGLVWQHGQYNPINWPRGFMYMTPPELGQGPWASKMIVNAIMPYGAVRQWENSSTGHRGPHYEQWKAMHVAKVMSRLEELYPGFGTKVATIYSASPLTIRDYYNVKEGALYGYSKDCCNIALSQVPVFTKVKNLLLTGQNINLHGICGVPLTAINTVEALTGPDTLVRKINAFNHDK